MARTGTLFISAPSGTGKSTLITSAIARRPEQRVLYFPYFTPAS